MRQFLLAFEVILWKWHYFKCYFLSRHVCCLCVYCSCHCLTPNADRRMASHTDCCQNRTFDNVFDHFGLGHSCTPSTHCPKIHPRAWNSANQPLIMLQLHCSAACRLRRKKAEFSMLNAQRWSGWIDSYAMAIFDIFQPNWNLFDYPNKVQIASSRSITTTGNG